MSASLRLALVLAVLALVLPGAAVADDWFEPAPGSLNGQPAGAPDTPYIANVGGSPYVGWGELNNTASEALFVKQLTAGGWTEVGPATGASDLAHDTPSVHIADFSGTPFVAYGEWDEPAHINQIYVRKFDAGSWDDVSTPASLNENTAHNAFGPSIANVGGTPYVAFSEENAGGVRQLYVKSFTSPNWGLVGGAALNMAATTDAVGPSVASIGGTPYVAWREDDNIYVKAWNGSTWSEPEAGQLNTNDASLPIVADIGGVPYVSWIEDNGPGPSQTFVKRFTGGTWSAVGSGPVEADLTHDGGGVIANIGGQPYVAINQFNGSTYTAIVRRFTGSAWTTVGSALNIEPANNAIEPRLADIGGTPYVAWREGDGDCDFGFDPSNSCQVFVKRFGAVPAGTPAQPKPLDCPYGNPACASTCTNLSTLLATCADLAGPPGLCVAGRELLPQCLHPVVPRTRCNPAAICTPTTPGGREAIGSCANMGPALPECNVPRREVPTQCVAYGFSPDPLPGQVCFRDAPVAITNCPPPSPAVSPACVFSTTVTQPNAPKPRGATAAARRKTRLAVTIGCPKVLAKPRCTGTITVDGLRASLLRTLKKQAEYSAGTYRYWVPGLAGFAAPFQKAANAIAKRTLGGTKLPKVPNAAKVIAELGRTDPQTVAYFFSLERAVKEYRKLAGKAKKRRRSKRSEAQASRGTTTLKRFSLKSGRKRARIRVRLSAATVRLLRRDAAKRGRAPMRVIVSFKASPRPVVRFVDLALRVR